MNEVNLGLYHFKLMFDVLKALHSINDDEELAKYTVSKISDFLDTEAGTFFYLESTGKLYPAASFGISVDELRNFDFKVGKGFAGWVIEHMQPIKVENPMDDPRFYGKVDLATGFKTKNIIAAPITSKDKPIGALEFINRKSGPFVAQDLELISRLGREIGIALEHIKLIKELEQKRLFQNAVTNSLSAGLITIDDKGNLLEINPRAEKILNISASGIEKIHYSKVLSPCPEFMGVIEQIMSSQQSINRQEIKMRINGSVKLIGYSGILILNDKKARLGSAILFQDITKYKQK